MTGNLQIDHRKHFIFFFTLTTAGGQFDSLQGEHDRGIKYMGTFMLN